MPHRFLESMSRMSHNARPRSRRGTMTSSLATDQRRTLRPMLRERRRQLPAAARIAGAEALSARLLALPFAPQAGHVAGYWASDGEIALHVWQLRLPPAVTYCLPVLHDDNQLRFAPWRAGEPLVTNRYGSQVAGAGKLSTEQIANGSIIQIVARVKQGCYDRLTAADKKFVDGVLSEVEKAAKSQPQQQPRR